ncbi:MAG TPA: hypothetical protein GX522_00755 [Firmicutes bacterium]|nr:hypothetical protein [Bacillota bacterium]
MERLDKILAHIGKGSRKEVKLLIREGLVKGSFSGSTLKPGSVI